MLSSAVLLLWIGLWHFSERNLEQDGIRFKLLQSYRTLASRLPQLYAGNPAVASAAAAANVRNCNCCPYGYHIDLDFVRYCESLANAKPSEEELRRRSRRRSRKSMEFMLGLDAMFEQWDAAARVQAVPEVSAALLFLRATNVSCECELNVAVESMKRRFLSQIA
ncbi:unnamed protein product [Ceratitis capitata]|uniref:(Mediterranean fruit fly) hypothetical protein n=1 Tax=Ceratitis capitata TaxID=7213 RepID=A0A811VBX5_CERCA|nr:unnamed protein product [Ceratitis capitata]